MTSFRADELRRYTIPSAPSTPATRSFGPVVRDQRLGSSEEVDKQNNWLSGHDDILGSALSFLSAAGCRPCSSGRKLATAQSASSDTKLRKTECAQTMCAIGIQTESSCWNKPGFLLAQGVTQVSFRVEDRRNSPKAPKHQTIMCLPIAGEHRPTVPKPRFQRFTS